MPRIGGINIVGVVIASLVFYFIGFIFYGVLFTQEWTHQTLAYAGAADIETIRQMSDTRLETAWTTRFPTGDVGLSMGLGFLNAVFMVVILAILLRQLTAGASSLLAYIGYGFLLAIGISVATIAMDHIYAYKPLILFWIDSAHAIVTYVAAAAILSYFE